jgi:prepilin-type N-terminal cleavage/methylation domain-containing protein/prepilin-type processing-associated H-X9-DG protein
MRSIRRPLIAFTLIEMVVVIAIIALIASLLMPNFGLAIAKAKSLKCVGNLHTIGEAASLAATDNHNRYPEIDQAGAPIYTPPGPNLITALGPYGIAANALQCPIDVANAPSSFSKYGSSYEWDPVFDEEPLNETVIYITPTFLVPVNSSRVRLAMDFTGVHRGRPNVVFGDGHVAAH